jgi:prophage maintenance system killer protein
MGLEGISNEVSALSADPALWALMSEEISTPQPGGEIVVYEASDGVVRVEVLMSDETVWLTQAQIAELFGRERSVITKHLNNVFREGELERQSNVQEMHIASSDRPTALYSLDVVISVGYRIKSKRGTQFRIWATNTLRDHLIRGFTLNEKRLRARGVEFDQAVALLSSTLRNHQLVTDEGQAVLEVVQRYARSWQMLRAYDEDQLSSAPDQTSAPIASLDIGAARGTIRALHDDILGRGENPGMFGHERGDALESVLSNIEQTWDGKALYPTIESRAAHLLYFVIKDHPLLDGNKRTGSLLFLDYLRRNRALLGSNGQPRFSDTALVALTLLVAESQASNKDLVIRLILNLLAEDRP